MGDEIRDSLDTRHNRTLRLGGVLGAALRLLPWYAEDRLKTPFYDNELASQMVSVVLFVGLCVYLWMDATRRPAEQSA